jgi:phage shock protein PspC (stress-responsive transcriptional regulator)
MNKVITINLGGTAYQLEEGGYDALRAYLEIATARLQGNPDRDEILLDIERAIAEKFRALLGSYKTVVVTKEVAAVLAEMGPIEAEPGEATDPGASGGAPSGESGHGTAGEERAAWHGGTPRRLHRVHEGAMIAGVCNGIAAYVNIDPTLVRLAFVLLTMIWGTGVLVYLVMAIVVPEARSSEEKAAASGAPSTAQEFIRRAKEGYYEAMRGFPDRKSRREWKRRFKREMRANADQWRHHWHGYWAEHAALHPGMGFALPLLSLLQGTATVLWFCALKSEYSEYWKNYPRRRQIPPPQIVELEGKSVQT